MSGHKRLLLSAISMAGLLHYYCHQPSVLHVLLVKVLDVLFGARTTQRRFVAILLFCNFRS